MNDIVTWIAWLGLLMWEHKGAIIGFLTPIAISLLFRIKAIYDLHRGVAPNHVKGVSVYVVGKEVRVEPVEGLDMDVSVLLPSSSEFKHILAHARRSRHSRKQLPSPFLVLPQKHIGKIWGPVERISRKAMGHDGMLAATGQERTEDTVLCFWLYDETYPGQCSLTILFVLRQQLHLIESLLDTKEKLRFGSEQADSKAEADEAEHIVTKLIPALLAHLEAGDDVAKSGWRYLLVRN